MPPSLAAGALAPWGVVSYPRKGVSVSSPLFLSHMKILGTFIPFCRGMGPLQSPARSYSFDTGANGLLLSSSPDLSSGHF